MLQTIVIVVTLLLTLATIYLVVRAVRGMVGVVGIGQPVSRSDQPGRRTLTMLKETFGHTRMFQWRWVGVMHWFVYFGFLILASAVATGFVQLFKPSWQIWWIGHWFVFEWIEEGIGVLSTIGIVFLIVYRQLHKPAQLGRGSRFYGSTFWQAYFVEFMALLEGVAILFIRGAERLLDPDSNRSNAFHFPVSHWISSLYGHGHSAVVNTIIVIAFIKVASALIWLDVIARNLTMGIAWHRFTAWFNIWFKREGSGRTALGAIKPLTSAGKAITLDDIDDLDEDATLGAGSITDFSWKGILDFTTCTECGRCQSQCPAWNTEKPLSPKLLVMGLREQAYAAAPYLQNGDGEGTVAAKALVGKTDKDSSVGAGEEVADWFYNPEGGDFVIDEDVLWSCTSCGACVQQCPVDIEHVDHIMDMRRYQVLVESNFPTQLNSLFRGLENNGNPWNMSPRGRMDWAKGLDFDVPVVGRDLESLESVDWLFWVGCAGAYENRAQKTTRAVAELLNIAGISFGVLGEGETCTGDSARRAGNEFVFQGLAQQNVETFKEFKVKKAVTTCAHCFNTLKNEYKEFGIELEVVHHTQLLNRLVREGKLTPVADGAGAHKRSITYHDPCYIGRHNGVYTPPRELLQVLPGADYVEMPRNSERSFCCGAGGARMWMEENLGSRINRNRTDEAVATGADQIAVGCPFCRVMLSDGLTAAQSDGTAREEVEVLDVAQMLLASVRGEQATKMAPGEGAALGAKVATAAEPSPAEDSANTITETADAGPAAKASQETAGSSLFDTPAPTEESASAPDDASSLFDTPAPAEPESTPAEPGSGGSLFDDGGSLFDTPAEEPAATEPEPTAASEPEPEAKAEPESGLGGGSLFDIPAEEPAAPAGGEQATQPAQQPDTSTDEPDLGAGGSLFDIPAAEQAPAAPAAPAAAEPAGGEPATDSTAETVADAPPAEEPTADQPDSGQAATDSPSTSVADAPQAAAAPAPGAGTASAPRSDVDIASASSLFDIEAPEAPEGTAATPAGGEAATDSAAETVADAPPAEEPTVDQPDSGEAATDSPSTPVADAPPAAAAPAPGSGTASPPRSDVDIASASSLFDIEAPEAPQAPESTEGTAPAPAGGERATDSAPETVADPPPSTEPADEELEAQEPTTEEPTTEEPTTEEPTTEEPTTEEPTAEEPASAEQAPEDKPATPAPQAPTSSGATHAPRTDVDINEAGSLFDL